MAGRQIALTHTTEASLEAPSPAGVPFGSTPSVPASPAHVPDDPAEKVTTEEAATSRAISELRLISGLTWDELAQMFGVPPPSVHSWASGGPMNAAAEEHLLKVLDIVRHADHGDTRSNRMALFTACAGKAPFDLLKSRAFDEASARLGRRPPPPRIKLRKLDARAQAERRPLPPGDLVDALNDRVHREIGGGRAASTVRKRRRAASKG